MDTIRIKPLTKEQIIISIDRLTRFKYPEDKYLRVFKEIVTNFLINPKYKKSELDAMDYEKLKELAEKVLNFSLEKLACADNDLTINEKLYEYENTLFKLDENVQKLVKNKINYKSAVELIGEDSPKNLLWLKSLACSRNLKLERKNHSLRFPIEKVVITEGITEEILLPEFAKICGYNFDQNGVYILSAGGKNKVVKMFYQYAEVLKAPIFVLLDKDAVDNLNEITPRLRAQDKIHLLNSGEFEDALTPELIQKTLNYSLKNISVLETIPNEPKMVQTLEEIYRNRGMHEFKKSEFAQNVKNNLSSIEDVSDEIKLIIEEIKALKK